MKGATGPFTNGEYEKFLRDTSWYKHANENSSGELAYLALGLAGETGEFIDEIKKIVRVSGFADREAFGVEMKGRRKKLIAELGDVLWYFTRIMDVLGTDVQELQVRNTYKLYERLIENESLKEPPEWPFSDPFSNFDAVQEQIQREEDDVHID